MDMKGRAVILEKLNAPLVIREVQTPRPDVGQVLVKVYVSGICGAQIGEITGAKGADPYLPHLMGHEGGGIVIDIGAGVKHVKMGDHVVMHWRKGVGIEAEPPKYWGGEGTIECPGYEIYGGGPITTFNEYAIVSENRVTSVDKDIPFEILALMGCAVTTGLGLINNEAKLKIGESIAVAGCGGVGLNVIQGASMVSAFPIIAIDRYDKKLSLASRMGATYLINTEDEDMVKSVHDLIKDVDVFVDCTGNVEVIGKGYSLVAPGGKMILVGQPRHDTTLPIYAMRRHYTGKVLFDSQGGLTNPTVDIPRYLDLYKQGKLKLDDLITHRFKLAEVNEAIAVMEQGEAGRCILTMT